jgi:hypothetical protein
MRRRACLGLLSLSFALLACSDDEPAAQAKACAADADCGELVCVADLSYPPADLQPMPLRCAQPGSGAQSRAVCIDAADCAQGVCLLAGTCAAPCSEDTQCGAQASCAAVYARSTPDTLATLHACTTRVELASDASVDTQLRTAALNRGMVTLELPPPTAASTLYVLEHLDDASWPIPDEQSLCRPPLCAARLSTLDPDERVLFDVEQEPADGAANPVAVGSHVNPLDVLVPNGPRAPLAAAGYRLVLEAKQPGDLRITSLARTVEGRRLDLNLFYVGARDLVVYGDRGIAPLSAALDEVERIFAQADIFIGEVRQISVHGELLERGTPLPDAEVSQGFRHLKSQYQVLPQLPELFKLSAGASNIALDVFFVGDIDSRNGGDVGGIAGGTPVPFGMHGTSGSGIAIATDMFLASGDSLGLGRTLAHELGHALGLFHTSEVDGTAFDPLPDTPVCHDSDGNGSLDARECAAKGGDNLMFPTSDASDSRLTPDQIAVLQRALILQ